MRTYYSFTIFAEPACELNTNQKNDLQTQSAFCQVCLLVSGPVSLPFFGILVDYAINIC